MVVEEMDVGIQKGWNIFSVSQIEVKKKLFLHPAIQRFNNWIICWSCHSRHGTKYVIMMMGLAKGLRRVDSSLVGVEDYWRSLLFSFLNQFLEHIKTVIVRLVAALDWGGTVGKDLVIESI